MRTRPSSKRPVWLGVPLPSPPSRRAWRCPKRRLKRSARPGCVKAGSSMRRTETWPDGTLTACYRFRHALYHEVVYRRVSAGRRVRLHHQIGARLERGYGDNAPRLRPNWPCTLRRGTIRSGRCYTSCRRPRMPCGAPRTLKPASISPAAWRWYRDSQRRATAPSTSRLADCSRSSAPGDQGPGGSGGGTHLQPGFGAVPARGGSVSALPGAVWARSFSYCAGGVPDGACAE